MNMRISGSAMLILGAFLLSACAPKNVSFSAEVRPILEKRCLECHVPGGAGYNASGFDMSSYATFMKGGKFGAYVIPGDPLTSALNMLVEGRADPSIRMPHGREKLGDREIQTLRIWVLEGAKDN